MTYVLRLERYTTNACIDREDAEAMEIHLRAVIGALSTVRVPLALTGSDPTLMMHYARLVRIMQRATQPNIIGRAACCGVERITYEIEDGRRTFKITCTTGEVLIDATRRVLRLAARGDVRDYRQARLREQQIG